MSTVRVEEARERIHNGIVRTLRDLGYSYGGIAPQFHEPGDVRLNVGRLKKRRRVAEDDITYTASLCVKFVVDESRDRKFWLRTQEWECRRWRLLLTDVKTE